MLVTSTRSPFAQRKSAPMVVTELAAKRKVPLEVSFIRPSQQWTMAFCQLVRASWDNIAYFRTRVNQKLSPWRESSIKSSGKGSGRYKELQVSFICSLKLLKAHDSGVHSITRGLSHKGHCAAGEQQIKWGNLIGVFCVIRGNPTMRKLSLNVEEQWNRVLQPKVSDFNSQGKRSWRCGWMFHCSRRHLTSPIVPQRDTSIH